MSTTQRTGREAVATRHLINRLHRIEGQVRGIAKMVERDAKITEAAEAIARLVRS